MNSDLHLRSPRPLATFELITDIGISNFVFSSPRSVYAEAIAGAHAISIVRGFCVGELYVVDIEASGVHVRDMQRLAKLRVARSRS